MNIVVLSPHLDDAALSVGAAIAALVDADRSVVVVTVFAGDPSRATRPSPWDARRATLDASDVFQARRNEDAEAMDVLGAQSVWLPFDDSGYLTSRDPDEIWGAIEPYASAADVVLAPGYPIEQSDHRWLTMLATERIDHRQLGFYAELPYAARPKSIASALIRGRTSHVLRHLASSPISWSSARTTTAHRERKRSAVQAYQGELSALGWRSRLVTAWDMSGRGEWLGLGSDVNLRQALGPVLS